jgi:hypothetical protein
MLHYEALRQCSRDRGDQLLLEAEAERLVRRSRARRLRRIRLDAALELLRTRGAAGRLNTSA